ncbi:MAG: ABC-F family ATP-binding cassette domain-containing protein [Caulobacteraceae bacterium]
MLRLSDLTFDAWGRRLFEHASAFIPAGAKVGLVGRNGSGKSTLFRLILSDLVPGEGAIDLPRGAIIGAVAQEHAASPLPLIETVLAADAERARLMAELETAGPERIGEVWARLSEIGADRAPARAAEILCGLGFSTADLPRPIAEFSGGWRMRSAMAAALFSEPDLLLLDEPTNYLDLEGALWLASRLEKWPKTAIIISHDRELLDRGVDSILHLTEKHLEFYSGGFSAFERQRGERLALQTATRAKIEARRAHMQSFVDRFRAKASKARQAQSRLKMIARLQTIVPSVEPDVAPFRLPSPARPLGPPLIRLERAQVGYGGPPVLRDLDLRLDPEDRIALLGVNGSGKTTFARLLAGALPLMSGSLHRAPRLEVGWFHQHQIEVMEGDASALQLIGRSLPGDTEARLRSRLAAFGMGVEKAQTRIVDLSGGERARLLLGLIALRGPHILILDEPTNHLDIDSRAALAESLNDYAGAVVLISHDRALIELVAERLWLIDGGRVKPFEGDMADYARFVLSRATRRASGESAAGASLGARPKEAERRFAAAEAALAREQRRLSDLDAASPSHRLNAARASLARAEEAWIAAAETLEGLSRRPPK